MEFITVKFWPYGQPISRPALGLGRDARYRLLGMTNTNKISIAAIALQTGKAEQNKRHPPVAVKLKQFRYII